MVLWIICGYLALAAIFYVVLTATATDTSIPAIVRHPKWHRARKVKAAHLLRRIRRD